MDPITSSNPSPNHEKKRSRKKKLKIKELTSEEEDVVARLEQFTLKEYRVPCRIEEEVLNKWKERANTYRLNGSPRKWWINNQVHPARTASAGQDSNSQSQFFYHELHPEIPQYTQFGIWGYWLWACTFASACNSPPWSFSCDFWSSPGSCSKLGSPL